jgi:hypothetical protein
VSDGRGGSDSKTTVITVGTPPVAEITSPASGAFYNAGDTIAYAGAGTDAEDGSLPASSFSWTIVFHHDTHTHPFLGPINGVNSGSFQIPQIGETAANVWYRIHLTVSDSSGLKHEVTRDILPNVVTLTLSSNIPGASLTLDGQPAIAPITVQGVVGIQRSIGAPSPQSIGGGQYGFVSWSDGGAATHPITTPATSATYTATFQRLDSTPLVITAVASNNVTSNSAVISWVTNEPSDSRVEYGKTTTYGSFTALETALITSHSQTLIGLAPGTLYHYRVQSKDAAGNPAVSSDSNFTTSRLLRRRFSRPLRPR